MVAALACAVTAVALVLGSPRAAASVLPEPSSGTHIYTLEPLDYNIFPVMKTLFRGACAKAGPGCTAVWTPAALDPSHLRGVIGEVGPISIGAGSLDKTLRTDGDKRVVVFGYSQGAQVAAFWLRNLGENASSYAPAASTSFVFVGNPENTYSAPWLPKTPTDSGYAVTEIWRQYDGWADWPTHVNLLAYANAIAGMMYVHPIAYVDADPDDPANVTWTIGNTTYVMIPSEDLPLLQPLRVMGLGAVADALNGPLKKIVDGAYDHPQTKAEADAVSGSSAASSTEAAGEARWDATESTDSRSARDDGSAHASDAQVPDTSSATEVPPVVTPTSTAPQTAATPSVPAPTSPSVPDNSAPSVPDNSAPSVPDSSAPSVPDNSAGDTATPDGPTVQAPTNTTPQAGAADASATDTAKAGASESVAPKAISPGGTGAATATGASTSAG